jgi:DNA polymerase-3 subunit epsilon
MDIKNKYIVAVDVETTGLSFTEDYIIQIAAVKFDTEFNILDEMHELVIPINDFFITEEAFGKHGFTKDCILTQGRSFREVGPEFVKFIEGCDILTYNGKNFDIRMISKELLSIGINFDINRVFYDSYLLEAKLNPRTLTAVYKRYTGVDMTNAHDALADVKATITVFENQVKKFAEINSYTLDDIMQFDELQVTGFDGMIKRDSEQLLFNKGKYRNTEIMEVVKKDPGYIKWFMTNPEFDITTKQLIKLYYNKHKN